MISAYLKRNAAIRPITLAKYLADSIFRPTTFSRRESAEAEFADAITDFLVQNAIKIKTNNSQKAPSLFREGAFLQFY